MQIVKIWRSIVLFGVLAFGFALGATQLVHASTATPTILAGDDTKANTGG
jgi:hypothetical protein